jgi:hypothetical protein
MDNLMEIEARLWEYIDGSSDAKETAFVERLIAENAEWRAKYHELLELHQLIDATELEQPSMRFTKNVMEEIGKYHIAPATKTYINNKVIWGIALFFITAIVGFLIYGIAQIDWSVASNDQNPIGIDFTQVDYSRMFNNSFMNIFMMLNVVLGLMLLDRYLNDRKKKYLHKA